MFPLFREKKESLPQNFFILRQALFRSSNGLVEGTDCRLVRSRLYPDIIQHSNRHSYDCFRENLAKPIQSREAYRDFGFNTTRHGYEISDLLLATAVPMENLHNCYRRYSSTAIQIFTASQRAGIDRDSEVVSLTTSNRE